MESKFVQIGHFGRSVPYKYHDTGTISLKFTL